jgi:subtilisin family serine protease
LETDGVLQGDGVFIDDFTISGVAPFSFSGNEFEYSNGTSFAAPIVSGVAAMLLSHRPELSTQDVRKIILQSVTKVDGLADKVASGGIVNAYEAIKLANTWEIETPTPEFFSFSSSVSPSNTGSVSDAGSYESGSTISISATPTNGYQFSHWSGDASGSSNPLSITINQDTSIVANFSVTGTTNTSNNSWSSAVNLGNGWRSFSWFGEFFEVSQNWIYHANLGWLYRYGDDLNLLWFYSPQHGWLFTSKSIFPYLYAHNSKSWLYWSASKLYIWNNSQWDTI